MHGTYLPELHADIEEKNLKVFVSLISGKVQLYLDRWVMNSVDKAISVSDFQIEEMVSLYNIPEEKIVRIHNGVDLSSYHPDVERRKAARNDLNIDDEAPVVLFVGRLVVKKGVQFLIEAAPKIIERYPDVRFLIIGATEHFGPYKSSLIEQTKSMGIADHFIWKMDTSEDNLPKYFNASDVQAVPSINYESIPTVIFEGMASGLPVVLTDRWGVREQINGYGFFCKEKNSDQIAEKILTVLQKDSSTISMVTNARERVRQFDWHTITDQHLELYADFVKQNG